MGYTYVLDSMTQYPGVKRNSHYGVKTYYAKSGVLPPGLRGAQAPTYSWEAHTQRLINHDPTEPNTGTGVTPRDDNQRTLITSIVNSYRNGSPGFVMSYPTGFGKTYVAIGAVNEIKPKRILVLAPLAYVDGWRAAIARAATGDTEWVVLNPDRLTSTFRLPSDVPPLHAHPVESRAPMALKDGIPITEFDMVISDEAQAFAHISSFRTRLWQALIGWRDNGEPPKAFTLNLSATNWSTPLETVSAAHILAAARNIPVPSALETEVAYDQWLRENFNLGYNTADGRWRWDKNIGDLNRLTEALYSRGMGASASRESLGMSTQSRIVFPIHLTPTERDRYPQSWRAFLSESGQDVENVDEPQSVRSRYLRQIQKAALIKAPYVADLVVDSLRSGHQVIVPAWLTTTITELVAQISAKALDRIGPAPTGGRWAISLTGADVGKMRDTKIRGFQAGFFPVIVTSVTTGISLHANQADGGFNGNPATSAPRVTIFGDVRWGGKQSIQSEGRGARDGEEADAIYCVAVETAEAQAMANVFRALADTRALAVAEGQALTDADIQSFTELADDLEAMLEGDPT